MAKYKNKNHKNDQPDILQTIFVGIFKIIWWLLTLPFKGLRKQGARGGFSAADRNHIAMKRQEIERLSQSQSSIELKHAVMEADKLVDYAFIAKGYNGETFADRLRNARSYLTADGYDQLWQAHLVRNKLAHESYYEITNIQLKQTIDKLLRYLRAL
jgi:hypothetical protein